MKSVRQSLIIIFVTSQLNQTDEIRFVPAEQQTGTSKPANHLTPPVRYKQIPVLLSEAGLNWPKYNKLVIEELCRTPSVHNKKITKNNTIQSNYQSPYNTLDLQIEFLMHWMIQEIEETLKMIIASSAWLCAQPVEPSSCYFKTKTNVNFGILLFVIYCLVTA